MKARPAVVGAAPAAPQEPRPPRCVTRCVTTASSPLGHTSQPLRPIQRRLPRRHQRPPLSRRSWHSARSRALHTSSTARATSGPRRLSGRRRDGNRRRPRPKPDATSGHPIRQRLRIPQDRLPRQRPRRHPSPTSSSIHHRLVLRRQPHLQTHARLRPRHTGDISTGSGHTHNSRSPFGPRRGSHREGVAGVAIWLARGRPRARLTGGRSGRRTSARRPNLALCLGSQPMHAPDHASIRPPTAAAAAAIRRSTSARAAEPGWSSVGVFCWSVVPSLAGPAFALLRPLSGFG